MHPKTAAALKELTSALSQAQRLHRRLTHLSVTRPPIYWELDLAALHLSQQLVWKLEQEKAHLAAAQQACEK